MKVRRIVVVSLAALVLLAALWLVGGNAWATHREEQCDPAWTTEFGSLEDQKNKYPKRETNETAKRLEVLTKDLGFDLAPREAGGVARRLTSAEEKRGQAIIDYMSAQTSRPEASIDPPPEEVSRFFEEKSVGLDAIELLLVAGPSPQWSFDLSESDRLPNGLGQIRLQRVLMARALAAARGGRSEAAARTLEASWNLNESLRGRPETIPALLSIAIARLQVGAKRERRALAGGHSRGRNVCFSGRILALRGVIRWRPDVDRVQPRAGFPLWRRRPAQTSPPPLLLELTSSRARP